MAGDSAVSRTINQIIELQARRFANIFEMRAQLHPPLCIVPVGATNMIANSIYGTTDLETPLMYLLYGIAMSVDICSVYTNGDKLHSFGFGFSCGFGTSVARYLQRFSKLGTNKVRPRSLVALPSNGTGSLTLRSNTGATTTINRPIPSDATTGNLPLLLW